MQLVTGTTIQLLTSSEFVRKEAKSRAHPRRAFPCSDFWLLREHMFPLNETTTRLPLKVMFSTSAHWKFQLLATLDDSFNKNAATGVSSGSELDEVKRMLTETSPYLLITTVVVTILHMLFEMLAFTSDVAHWRSKKDSVGVSLRTICTNVVVQLIILLYLLDNNENTSWMVSCAARSATTLCSCIFYCRFSSRKARVY